MIDVWRQFAMTVTGGGIDAGHYLAEQAPDRVLDRLIPFMAPAVATMSA